MDLTIAEHKTRQLGAREKRICCADLLDFRFVQSIPLQSLQCLHATLEPLSQGRHIGYQSLTMNMNLLQLQYIDDEKH